MVVYQDALRSASPVVELRLLCHDLEFVKCRSALLTSLVRGEGFQRRDLPCS